MEGRDEKGRFVAGNQVADKYEERYADMLEEYFSVKPQEVYTDAEGTVRIKACECPTMFGFAADINVDGDTLQAWARKYPRFRLAYARALERQKHILFVNGLAGAYNPNITKFMLSCVHGLVEKSAVELGNTEDKAFKVDIKVVD